MNNDLTERILFLRNLYNKEDYESSIIEAQSLYQEFNTNNDIRYSKKDLLNVLNIWGHSLKETNQTFKAIEIFNTIIDKLPNFHEGYQGLAEIYTKQEDWDNAIEFTKKLLSIDTNHHLDYWWTPISQSKKWERKTAKYKKVIAIRTHIWGIQEENIYQTLLQYFQQEEIFVVMEELANKPEVAIPSHINKISLNDEFIERNNLLSIKYKDNLGWLCGDYFYYALAEQIDADFYWLIEPDVGFTFCDISDFFTLCENNLEDGLLVDFKKSDNNWFWVKHIQSISLETYHAFFPLSRLSKLGVLACMAQRKRITQLFTTGKIALNLYPNDESLVASSLAKYQMNVVPLNNICDCFNYFNLQSKVNPKSMTLFPRNQIIHPIRTMDNACNNFLRRIKPSILQELEKYYIHDDDITEFSEVLQIGLHDILNNALMTKKFIKYYELKINNIINTQLLSSRKNLRLWVYNKSTLVLDYRNNDISIALDVTYHDDNNIVVSALVRQKNDKVYDIIEKFYKQNLTMQARIKLYNVSIIDFEQKLDKIMHDFILLCQEFECCDL